MDSLLYLALVLIVVFACGFYRVSRFVWTPVIGATLLFTTIYGALPIVVNALFWLMFAAIALLFNVDKFRRDLISLPLLKNFRKILPPISETEQIALDAGDTWWEKDLFCGEPDWKKLLDFPKASLNEVEQAFVDNETQTLCSMIDEWEMQQEYGDLSPGVWEYAKKHGFLGLIISKDYGGLGFSAYAHSVVINKIASRSYSAAVSIMVPNSLGPAELLSHYGTDTQKKHYLPRLAKGEEIPCFALTGTESGSDAASMLDLGVVCKGEYEGKQVTGISLTWEKRYITLAPIATLLGLAFKLSDPDHLLGDKTDLGITLCLIPTSHPGVEIGDRHCPMNMPFLNGPTSGKDVFIPLDLIIGGQERIGQGWRMLMECLGIGRSISLPAVSSATAKLAYRMSGAYARVRKQFGLSIGKFEGVAEALGRVAGYNYMMEACRRMSASAVDMGVKPALVSAIAKYHMTELSRKVLDDALDVHAGKGLQLGPHNYLGQRYFAIPIGITVEGANILTRNLMIFGQGAVRCHPYVRDEIAAVGIKDDKEALSTFDAILAKHIAYTTSNIFRCLVYGFSAGKLIPKPVKGDVGKYYQQMTRMSSALAYVADIAMLVMGGELKRRERLSARLGDVLSQLYIGSTVLKYYDKYQENEDVAHVHWCMQEVMHKIQIAFDEFFQNFPNRALARVMRFIVFPFGRSYQAPDDDYSKMMVDTMLAPSSFRDRVTEFCYKSTDVNDAAGLMEVALQRLVAAEPADKKLQAAIRAGTVPRKISYADQIEMASKEKVLTETETKTLQDYEAVRKQAISVDNFPFDYLNPRAIKKLKESA